MYITKGFILGFAVLINRYAGSAQSPGTFTHRIIDRTPPENICIKNIGDFNADGHIDLLIGGHNGRTSDFIIWYQNPSIDAMLIIDVDDDEYGDGSNDWKYHQVSTVSKWADRFYMADLNKDGRTDIVISTANGTEDGVYLFEAPADPTDTNWEKHLILLQELSNSMDVADIDNDGDTDILVGQHYTGKMMTPRKLQILEDDGFGNFSQHLMQTGNTFISGAMTVLATNENRCNHGNFSTLDLI